MRSTTIGPAWRRAIERAQRDHLKATLRRDGTYRVPSASHPDTTHTVTLDGHGHIDDCDCQGWQRYGRERPCKHAAAAAIAICYFSSIAMVPASEPTAIEHHDGRSRALLMEAGA